MPVQKENVSTAISSDGGSGVSSDRLQAVARGDNIPAEVHKSVGTHSVASGAIECRLQ